MPYLTPNLTTLQQQALSDIQSANIGDTSGNKISGLLQKSVLRVLALVQAAFAYLHFRYIDYVALQTNPYTATDEYLTAWMALKGVNRIDATKATGAATFLGSSGTIPQGYQLNRQDGATFFATSAASVSGTAVTVSVIASAAGSASTINIADPVSLSSPIAGITATGTFSAITQVGTDQETDDALRTRGLQAYAAPSQGGAASDYVEWAEEVPGVTRAWCPTSAAGAGTVQVYFMEDVTQAAYQGIPQGTNGVSTSETRATAATGDQLAVANYIYPLRPVTAEVYALAPTPSPQNYAISNLSPNTAAITSGIVSALLDMGTRVATPGGTTRPDGNPGGELYESDWTEAINSVPGVLAFDVTSPTGTIVSGTGTIFTVGTITANGTHIYP